MRPVARVGPRHVGGGPDIPTPTPRRAVAAGRGSRSLRRAASARPLSAAALSALLLLLLLLLGLCRGAAPPAPPTCAALCGTAPFVPLEAARAVFAAHGSYDALLLAAEVEALACQPANRTVRLRVATYTDVANDLAPYVEEYERLRPGVTVELDSLELEELPRELKAEAQSGTSIWDAFIYNSNFIGDLHVEDGLASLSDLIKRDPALDWQDLELFYREIASKYANQIVALPNDGDVITLFYRRDVLDAAGLEPPATWEEYLRLAERFDGADLNRDGVPDYSSCIGRGGFYSWVWLTTIAAPMLQTMGSTEGMLMRPSDLKLFIASEAMVEAFETLNATAAFGPPDEFGEGNTLNRRYFAEGRCLMTINYGSQISNLYSGSNDTLFVDGKMGVAMAPGAVQVLDKASGRLVDCSQPLCPHAEDVNGTLVNFAPYAASGWTSSVNNFTDQKAEAYDFIAWLNSPAVSLDAVFGGVERWQPFRRSHTEAFDDGVGPPGQGLSPGAVEDYRKYLQVARESFESPNIATDLRIPGVGDMQRDLDGALLELARAPADRAAVESALARVQGEWEATIRKYGEAKIAEEYNKDLGIKQYAEAAGGAEQGGVSEVVVIAVSVACGSVALLAVVLGAYKWRAGRPARVYRRPPDPDSPDTSFASTDIQCSTELWEMFPHEMSLAVKMHNSLLKSLIKKYHGYLSFTEGDAYNVVFHTTGDAVAWAVAVQKELLRLPWPERLLEHPAAAVVHRTAGGVESPASAHLGRSLSSMSGLSSDGVDGMPQPSDSTGASSFLDSKGYTTPSVPRLSFDGPGPGPLYRGLRVRIGIESGGGGAVTNQASSRRIYTGPGPARAKLMCDLVPGGCVCIPGTSYSLLPEIGCTIQAHHFGEYRLAEEGGGSYREHVVALHHTGLAERVLHIPSTLARGEKLSPMCLEAPRGDVCLAFVHYPVADHLQACDPPLAHKTLEDLNAALRDTLRDFAGYEVECMPGFFYASFSSSEAALRWATSAQEVTMELDWPDELLEVPGCEELAVRVAERTFSSSTFSRAASRLTLADRQDSEAAWDARRQASRRREAPGRAGPDPGDRAVGPEFVTMFRGPRAKIGVHSGVHAGVIDPSSGRTTYPGTIANRTARIAAAAAAGQVVASEEAVLGLALGDGDPAGRSESPLTSGRHAFLTEDMEVVELGTARLKGFRHPVKLYQCATHTLAQRNLPKQKWMRQDARKPLDDPRSGELSRASGISEDLRGEDLALALGNHYKLQTPRRILFGRGGGAEEGSAFTSLKDALAKTMGRDTTR